jgi:tetratricopeptide (TPR) repeat protein
LVALLVRAKSGEGGVALVTGEPGIGKTRLLDEVAARAKGLGFAVAWGRAWELGGAPTYWPWIEALRALFARHGGRDEAARELIRLLPELDSRIVAAPGMVNRDAFQLCDAVSTYLQTASLREPLLLVLDDLHAADPSSLALADFVGRKLRDIPMALFGSHRDVEARLTPEVEAPLARLARSGETWVLGPLGLPEIENLVRENLGRTDPETARLIHEATEGNPLFAEELLRLVGARGALRGSGVPAGVRAVIRERLSLLAPATVALLQAAAVVGREFDLAVAAEAAGVTTEALADAIEEAERAEIVGASSPGRHRFSHALFAETLTSDLARSVRAKLHRRTADVLLRRHEGHPAPPLDEIAHHLLEAGAEVAEEAIAAAERAAVAASARLGFADAATMYERAFTALVQIRPGDAARCAELLVLQGAAWARASQRARAEAACENAAEIARNLGDGILFARAALALGAEVSVGQVDVGVIRLLEQALRLLPEGDGPWRAQVMARLASARQPALVTAEPMDLGREAIRMARRLGGTELLLAVLHSAIGALVDYAPPDERAMLNEEAARLAEASGDRPRALRARMRLVFDRADLLDLPGFERALAAYETVAKEVRQPRYESIALMFHSMRANWEGRFADGDRLEDEARQLRDAEREGGPPFAPVRSFGTALLREDPAEIDRAFDSLMRFYPDEARLTLALRARSLVNLGKLEEARSLVNAQEASGFQSFRGDIHACEISSAVAWALRDRSLAEPLYADLLHHAGRPFLVTGIAFSLHGVVDHARMQLAHVLGRYDEADRHAASALAACAQIGAPPIEAAILRDHAISLSERGPASDRVRAARLIREALAIYERLGLGAVAQHCRELVDGNDSSAAPITSEKAPVAPSRGASNDAVPSRITLELEGEYWTVRGLGVLCRVRDNRGMHMLAQLLADPGHELHVLDLAGSLEPVDGGDAGEMLDREARTAYERRLRDLVEEIDEAEAHNDLGRRQRLEEEAEMLRAELSRALGLGGRERRAGSLVERARVNVRRRLALAVRRVSEANSLLGRHIAERLRTGVYCVYEATCPPTGRSSTSS